MSIKGMLTSSLTAFSCWKSSCTLMPFFRACVAAVWIFQRKATPEPQKPRRLQPKSSLPQGPTAPNSAAEINAIQVGMRVRHAKFGEGKVLTIEGSGNDRKATIFFDQVGQKTMMLVYAKLVIINQ